MSFITDILSTLWNGMKTVTNDFWDGIKKVAKDTWDGVEFVAKSCWKGTKKVVRGVWDSVKAVLNFIIDNLERFSIAIDRFLDTLRRVTPLGTFIVPSLQQSQIPSQSERILQSSPLPSGSTYTLINGQLPAIEDDNSELIKLVQQAKGYANGLLASTTAIRGSTNFKEHVIAGGKEAVLLNEFMENLSMAHTM